ncbi:bifunctional 4-hydroxy-2-oxoglutarate aldolase/2-dehydro-3-deoxy-phosphogluconate aldolase [Streptomyces profundus]|uniref:bifunctional 4-hydroxy-2-oxoglutarate aldolase/2-dehydro-3-deoxy-phosphogluconate aldolase n=1 Tax=Streptomyces profundus TaxID=2867410 RepID=UPI001D160F41|nr:bifunctional 4-hydroxy-2-oxoglutarate aldolase/2-dehydro-3-deoxy-phosphogluconate aldolase [Streptomyces sp. MA3_2.13]UED84112.1 bifunctional 4-hydroxy-2-oxoglutarate aldolase/2-dehydro-3-deoxy-phosphogluconate aldolase [Streptomyces sp. MA3_2.13]
MNLLELLRGRRLLAIVRGTDRDAAIRAVRTLAEEGVGLVEVSLTGRDALEVIREASAELGPEAPLGAGTVLTAEDARAARDAGAAFVVTPGLGAGLTEARRLGLPTLAGALTPSEIIAALAAGATAVKVFPADSMGGPRYLRALRGPFPDVPLVPVGGVDAEAADGYLAGGATAVGVGSPLVGDAADGGDLDALRERARTYLRVAKGRAA